MSFVTDLQRRRASYNNCEQARMQAESLKLLSSGIYTEEERFIYELLQNAVDAFQDTKGDSLSVQIEIVGEYLIFAHNGKAFTEKDVEGLCDVGNGNKMGDKNKIGYKGIGFKSVFMKSSQVFIQSGEFSFKFDKEACPQYMPNHLKGLTCEEVPWQVIPIESPLPFPLPYTANVITCLKLRNSYNLAERICTLISNPEFLLFLNAPHICISFTTVGKPPLSIEKNTTPKRVELLKNQKVESQWIVGNSWIPIPPKINEYILTNPLSIPEKLKGETRTMVSFAIRTINGSMFSLQDTVAYTYLPTSFTDLKLPFLINANFITDASRQQLLNSPWNHNILYYAAWAYIQWMATISKQYSDSFCNVLPPLSVQHQLALSFHKGLQHAIDSTPFLPSKDTPNQILKVSESYIDKTNMSDVLKNCLFPRWLNQVYKTNFSQSSRLKTYKSNILSEYGVFTFNPQDLPNLFSIPLRGEKRDYYNLILHFYEETKNHPERENEWVASLKQSNFIPSSHGELLRPGSVFLPPQDKELAKYLLDPNLVDYWVYTNLKEKNPSCLQWLEDKLGLHELTNMRFVDCLLEGEPEITVDNAVEIGRCLFRIAKENPFLENEEYKEKMGKLHFLTKQGNLKIISALFLGYLYKPKESVEKIAPEKDIYISEKYMEERPNRVLIDEWGLFFRKCGANDTVGLTKRVFNADVNSEELALFPMLQKCDDYFKTTPHEWTNYKGYKNLLKNREVRVNYFALIDPLLPNRGLDKFIFSSALTKPYQRLSEDSIHGEVPFWSQLWVTNQDMQLERKYRASLVEKPLRECIPHEYKKFDSFLEYCLAEKQLFPTTRGDSLLAEEVYLNSETIISMAGPYLPVLDIDGIVHESWYKVIPFKKELTLEDYLVILEQISANSTVEGVGLKRNRIQKIYTKIIEQDFHITGQRKISEWGRSNKILSTNGSDFYSPSDLCYISVEGFNPKRQVFTGRISAENRNKIEIFLRCLGVQVITNVMPQFSGLQQDDQLERLLLQKLQYIALLKLTENAGESFEDIKRTIADTIKSYKYYHCEDIQLSYGDDSDTIKKSSFCHEKNIYYTGELILSNLQILVSNILSKPLGLSRLSEEVLTILCTPNHLELEKYLSEIGYKTDILTNPDTETSKQVLTDSQQNTDSSHEVLSLTDYQPAKFDSTYEDSTEGIISTSIDISLSKQEQFDAQLEAQKILMQTHSKWKFPSNYGESGSDGTPLNYSVTNDIFDEYGKQITVVLKSYRDETRPFHINANEWEALCTGGRLYLCVSRNSKLAIEEYDLNDLIIGQDKIRISFDATNLDPNNYKNKTQAFVDTLRYFSGMTFDFQRFVTRPANLYARREGSQTETNDNDL